MTYWIFKSPTCVYLLVIFQFWRRWHDLATRGSWWQSVGETNGGRRGCLPGWEPGPWGLTLARGEVNTAGPCMQNVCQASTEGATERHDVVVRSNNTVIKRWWLKSVTRKMFWFSIKQQFYESVLNTSLSARTASAPWWSAAAPPCQNQGTNERMMNRQVWHRSLFIY